MKKLVINAMLLTSIVALSACSGAPKKIDSLEKARTAYNKASNKEIVAKHAASELDDARSSLSHADKIWRNDGKVRHINHYAYIASQKVQIAELIAQRKEDDATARGIVATLGDVLFDSGKARLKESSMGNIQKVANFMTSYPERSAVVEGHTDSMGDDDFNYDLRITTRNLGESVPVADNNTREGRQQNRRVEVIFPDLGHQISELSE